MKHNHHGLKEQIELPNGVTLALSTVGEVVAIDQDGTRRSLDNDDHVRWFFHSVTDSFPEPPRIHTDPQAAERAAAAQANIAAKKPHDFKVTVDPDGSVIMTWDSGERVRLESA